MSQSVGSHQLSPILHLKEKNIILGGWFVGNADQETLILKYVHINQIIKIILSY